MWRDRYEYDPATGAVGANNYVSPWTRWRPARQRLLRACFNGPVWSALIGATAALGAVYLADYLNRGKAQQQVQPNAGELHLQCVQQRDGVLACRQIGTGKDKVITRTDRADAKDRAAAK